MGSFYSLKKSSKILLHVYGLYKKRGKNLTDDNLEKLEDYLKDLDIAIKKRDREESDRLSRLLESFSKVHFRNGLLGHVKEIAFALIFALVVATVIRQMWFEHYAVPTGSMRPTIEELDHLLISKLDFGLNIPIMPKHFYFDPDLVNRTGIVIFTVEDMDVPDPDTDYFYIFPGKKRYVKRLIGKPGDCIYFYGGKLWGIDKNGEELGCLQDTPCMKDLEYIPFKSFEGRVKPDGVRSVLLCQMNKPLVKATFFGPNNFRSKLLYEPDAGLSYADIWGMKNFGMTRLLNKNLEIRHSPTLGGDPLDVKTSVIPLEEQHLRAIMDNMYTSRFFVKDGRIARYDMGGPASYVSGVKLPHIPDGCYEFYHGQAWKILWGGIRKKLPKDHPIYEFSEYNVQVFYNLGVEFHEFCVPSRYTYFRDGDLYILGAPILNKDDPVLGTFLQGEEYFKDYGSPVLSDGSYNKDFIRKYGLEIPEKMYLVLGDNHSVSGDSRLFGFVPEDNLRGAPVVLIWPPGERWGFLPQKAYAIITFPRMFVWSVAVIISSVYWYWQRKKRRNFVFRKRKN